jgi:hypothetical protein
MRRIGWCVLSVGCAWLLGCGATPERDDAVVDVSGGTGGGAGLGSAGSQTGAGQAGTGQSAGSGGSGQAGNGQAGSGEAGSGAGGSGVAGQTSTDLGVPVTPAEPAGGSRAEIVEALSAVADITNAELQSSYAVPFTEPQQYTLDSVAGLALIDASSFITLNDDARNDLATRGFAISSNVSYPSFLYGYAAIYQDDLPVYVSADSILFALHRSYDAILKAIEERVLIADLETLLTGMRARLAGNTAFGSEAVRADADVYLTVAASLLAGSSVSPLVPGNSTAVASITANANAHSGAEYVEFFGVTRYEDFSQYEPRGHYTDSEALRRYFRSMMWLGRVDFRLLETQSNGRQIFRRRQLEAALALRELIGAEERARFDRLDKTIGAFVGEHDYMQLDELGSLLADLGVSDLAGLSARSDAEIAQAITDANYGEQRISSHIMINGTLDGSTLPLSASFALLGQRYVIDSHVFSNVVYDRVNTVPYRMMPDPLDAAFAAFGNDQSASLLATELEQYQYAPALAQMRVLADAHDSTFWDANLYHRWLGALRALSPNKTEIADPASGLPAVARGEAWGRRLLNTQLSSWAELRHDTLLYAKQSYTGGTTCEFPDAYVDPYPQFYERVGAYAEYGEALALDLAAAPNAADLAQAMSAHFALVKEVAGRLGEMAEHQRSGAAFTAEMLAFINEAVEVDLGCGSPFLSDGGWYGKLFFNPDGSLEFDPTIADVHTQPTDEGGAPVGRVLHVGTGAARPMVVIADGCNGPRAYAGLTSSYYEVITENFERMTDEEWAAGPVTNAPEPAWLSDVVR